MKIGIGLSIGLIFGIVLGVVVGLAIAVTSPDAGRITTGTAAPKVAAAEVELRDLPAFIGPLSKPKDPADNPTTDAKVELGRLLYYDPRLSGNGALSCASCHHPGLGWADGLAKGIGFGHAGLPRSSPSVMNSAFYTSQFWDGRAASLEAQAEGPMTAAKEMNSSPEKVESVLNKIPEYRTRFNDVFGEAPSFKNAAKAIAAFERIVYDHDSPFDRYARGDDKALSEQQLRGMELFTNKAKCATCHSGSNFSDNRFHNIGTDKDGDVGRFEISKKPEDKGAFKTPTCRNTMINGPYMHNGSLKTMREVIDHYEKVSNEGPDKHPNLSPLMLRFKLTDAEKDDLEAFIHTLTGDKHDPRINVIPVLPPME